MTTRNYIKEFRYLLFFALLPVFILVGTNSVGANGLPKLQQTVDSQSLQINSIINDISVLNSSVDELQVKNSNQDETLEIISSNLQSQSLEIQKLNDNYDNLNASVNDLNIDLVSLENRFNELSEKVENINNIPPKDFSFFTNHQFKYGGYFMSPAFDAKDYTKFSITFTCTSHTNDEVKYWIETSADGTNWSPWGYYHVRCNGIYSGASVNTGQMPARYFAIAVQPISNNSNKNTITSVGRFSN